ncbi:nucleotide pyrophosphohydrolase [Thiohalophilus thiocyanatoxydans]|uniref:NTP pyrophosphatase (Non-canonical NTP hydrolase) n=1 Tax=Thiohalophilus thiocyanatoxydans TaxID=381308 RepID=A0A4R8IJT2_9GAMM|nr:nucleotide pyrophosphohydrolase [Thiohalophilus thiocyanatoxydans]TDY00996.1 NTP pyrophosphatase (non-canonical NTP hydrolase) [Thiohalophilus thiocyanatoxydans]
MSDTDTSLQALKQQLKTFAEERDWEQFHSPKNLAMALIVEAAELVEHFQWLKQSESENLSPEKHREVAYEMADILVYLLRLAERLDIDLLDVVQQKMQINADKYPADQVRGSYKKYTEYKTK